MQHDGNFQLDRDAMVRILLEGGPDDLIKPTHVPRTVTDERRIKIPYGNGYEHFEMCSEEIEQHPPLPFRWKMRTKIAE